MPFTQEETYESTLVIIEFNLNKRLINQPKYASLPNFCGPRYNV